MDTGSETLLVFGELAEVTLGLYAMPERIRLSEEGTETDGHGGSDGTPSVYDLVDSSRGDADGVRHCILGDSHWLEILFEQDFAGGNGGEHGGHL